MRRMLTVVTSVVLCLALSLASSLAAPPARAFEASAAAPNDVARFLAGLPPAADSPLVPLTRERSWQRHARSLDRAWSRLEERRLARIRAWSAANLTDPKPVVLYMFSGPDFLYVDAFFRDRTTYVLVGLEPIGRVPTMTPALRRSLSPALAGLRDSVGSALSYSFFITKQMRHSLAGRRLRGVLPVLYLFLARSGKTIHDVSMICVDKDGAVVAAGTEDATPGVKITFTGRDKERVQTLYYFQTDLSNGGVKQSGFLKFCAQLGAADAFIKSASYLLHSGNFRTVREFLLERAAAIVQDDSGIPVRFFKANDWELKPFGRYLGPIPLFRERYQRALRNVYRRSDPPRLDFGVGYRWRPRQSNLLLALKSAGAGVTQEAARPK